MTESYLLDTNAILWTLAAPEKLSTAARSAIESGTLVLSVISYWEVMVKSNKGSLSVGDPAIWWRRACDELAAETLQLRTAHVSTLRELPDHHRDPFDRILIAQAIAEGMTFIASDEQIHKYPLKVTW